MNMLGVVLGLRAFRTFRLAPAAPKYMRFSVRLCYLPVGQEIRGIT